MLDTLTLAFAKKTACNLPVYGVNSKDLAGYVTSTKDKRKGRSRVPLQAQRIYGHNIFPEPIPETESEIL